MVQRTTTDKFVSKGKYPFLARQCSICPASLKFDPTALATQLKLQATAKCDLATKLLQPLNLSRVSRKPRRKYEGTYLNKSCEKNAVKTFTIFRWVAVTSHWYLERFQSLSASAHRSASDVSTVDCSNRALIVGTGKEIPPRWCRTLGAYVDIDSPRMNQSWGFTRTRPQSSKLH